MKITYFLLLMAAGTAACTDQPSDGSITEINTSQSSQGMLLGSIVLSPTCAVEIRDQPCPPKPAAGAKLTVASQQGESVMHLTADANGYFQTKLKPGVYRISLSDQSMGFSKNLPAMVEISSGSETRLDVVLDSGIR